MLQSPPLTKQDIAALTPIMAAAFDDDSKIHTGVEHDGPRGYDDGSLLLRQLADPALTCRKVLLDGSVIGAWTVRQQAAQCTLELFFLDPALHNQGLGQQVWQQIEGAFPQAEEWLLETPDYSTRNHHFYTKRCGFFFVRAIDYPNGGRSFLFRKLRCPQSLSIERMMQMQTALWEKHRESWSPMEPEYGKNFILWMMEEVGEVIAIVKKKGSEDIMQDPAVRSHFVEELSDVLMYYFDTLLRYGVTPQEISEAYCAKHSRNMGRDYEKEYQKFH